MWPTVNAVCQSSSRMRWVSGSSVRAVGCRLRGQEVSEQRRFDTLGAVPDLPIRRLDPHAPIPEYARPGDAGVDLVAAADVVLSAGGGRAVVPTGIAVAIPEGYAGFVQPRSGLARDHGVTCLNTPGLIDSGYRGELQVLLINTDPVADFEVKRGERIAQLVIQAVEHVRFVPVDELSSSERGAGGWGHTGR
jgi:dUTP pyrophosphatase